MSQLEERFSQPKYWEELISFCVGLKLRGFKRMADRSRMNREVHVRCCGGLEVKFLRSTQPWNFVLETGPSANDYFRDLDYPADAYF